MKATRRGFFGSLAAIVAAPAVFLDEVGRRKSEAGETAGPPVEAEKPRNFFTCGCGVTFIGLDGGRYKVPGRQVATLKPSGQPGTALVHVDCGPAMRHIDSISEVEVLWDQDSILARTRSRMPLTLARNVNKGDHIEVTFELTLE